MKLSVTLSLGSAAHHNSLLDVLAQSGVLRRALRFGEDLEVLEPDGGRLKLVHRFRSYRMGNRLIWGVWRRLPAFAQSTAPMVLWAAATDQMISRWLVPCNVFHGIAGSSLSSLRKARLLGARTLIDNTSLHPASWQREVTTDCAAVGFNPRHHERLMSPLFVRRLIRQYETCDRIIVYSSAAQASFELFPYASKTIVVRPGVDHHLFARPKALPRRPTFRACYVGRIEAPKGLAHLLAAWNKLGLADAELLLVGRVFSEMKALLSCSSASVKVAGFLPIEQVAECLVQSDIFVIPSVNEGMSLALLQAMSAGLPVIACQATAAEECITSGENGFLIPGRRAEALADVIVWCYKNRDKLAPMGQAARKRVEQEFTLLHYAQRLTRLYESLVV